MNGIQSDLSTWDHYPDLTHLRVRGAVSSEHSAGCSESQVKRTWCCVREPTISRAKSWFCSWEDQVLEFPVQGDQVFNFCTGNSKKLDPPGHKTVPGDDLWQAL